MSLLKVRDYLRKRGLDDRIMVFDVSSATVRDASLALNCKEEEIVKTLSFLVDDRPILIAIAGDYKIDNSKFKNEFHVKAKMIPSLHVLELIGHEVGGVCPFGVNDGVKIYLDISLKRLKVVYPAAGSSNSAVKLTLEEFEKISNFDKWIDVGKKI